MIFKATLSNKAHPEYGQATIPFPIPGSEYDHTIELLEAMGLGDTLAHDCRVDEISSNYPILNRLDGAAIAIDLINSRTGTVTPYGVVYSNDMKLEPLYDGRHFPAYLYEPPQMVIEVNSGQDGSPTGYLYLPAPDQQIQRTLQRAGAGKEGFRMTITMDDLPTQVSAVISPDRDSCDDLNRLCRAVEPLSTTERKKLDAVVLMAQPTYASEIHRLIENLEQFDFVPNVGSPEQNSRITNLGYVAYRGSLTLEELMRADPTEQHQQEQKMGGMA